MRKTLIAAMALCGFAATSTTAFGQVTPAASPPASAKPTLKSIGMIIYPAKGQAPDQQAADEAACITWAENQTGLVLSGGKVNVDSAAKASQQKMAEATTGAAVVGSAKGAATGAAIGAIAGDAGTGAAIGAVAGALGGRRAKKQAEAQAAQQGAQQAQAQSKAATDQFKKAAAACLQGRGYTVS
ncbi:MAG TPA: glycine zipper domain-containing protein [Gemmatimonadales bacterium]